MRTHTEWRDPRTRVDLAVAGLAAAIAAGVLVLIPQEIAGQDLSAMRDMASAAFFPGVTALGLLLLSIVLAGRALLAHRTDDEAPEPMRLRPVGATAAVLLLFAALMTTAGTASAMAVLIVGLALCFGYRRWRVIAVLAIVAPLVIVTVFERAMLILFPHGVLY